MIQKKPLISIIAAIEKETLALGKNNDLLHHVSLDLKRFKAITSGHVVIMGRKTFESIGKPLPNRTNIVITRNTEFKQEGILTANSLEKAFELAQRNEKEEIFIIGGAEIYKQSLPLADRLYITLIDAKTDGADVFFPKYSKEFNEKIFSEKHPETNPSLEFAVYKKGEA